MNSTGRCGKSVLERALTEFITQTQGRPMSDTPKITLSGRELRDALRFVNPDEGDAEQLDAEVTLFYRKHDEATECGEPLPSGWYCYMTEYPEEGCHGPLGCCG